MQMTTYFTSIKEKKARKVEVWDIAAGIFLSNSNVHDPDKIFRFQDSFSLIALCMLQMRIYTL